MDYTAIKQAAQQVSTAALRSLNFNHSRATLAAALIREAKAAGFSGNDVRFIANYGLAQSGYGGGI